MDLKTLRKRAQELRNNPTPCEVRLWQRLKGKQLGAKFRRQHVLAPFIVDFYCWPARLVIEVDGDAHNGATDLKRDQYLQRTYGVTVLRFTNEQVRDELEAVLDEIRRWL